MAHEVATSDMQPQFYADVCIKHATYCAMRAAQCATKAVQKDQPHGKEGAPCLCGRKAGRDAGRRIVGLVIMGVAVRGRRLARAPVAAVVQLAAPSLHTTPAMSQWLTF